MRASTILLTLPLLMIASGAPGAEKRVKMADLPAAVQKTVQEQSKYATVRGLSEEVENGKTYYEAELKVGGHNKDLLIDPTGSIVEIEEEVTLTSAPAAVQQALKKQAGKGQILGVESVTKNHAIVAYEARIKTAGKTSEISVSPEGAPLKEP
jgi:hypothetical protein